MGGDRGGEGPSPLYYLLISTKPLHNPPPLSPPTSVHLFTLVYPVACPFPPKSNPTHPLQEIIPALPEYFIANLANISRHSIHLKSVWSYANVSSLVATSSIYVGAVLGVTMGVDYLSTLGSRFRSPIFPYQSNIDRGEGWCCLLRWPWLGHWCKGICFWGGYGLSACIGVQDCQSKVSGGIEWNHRNT